MQVIYEKTIFEKIDDAIENANKENRRIEKIILDYKEWSEFVEKYTIVIGHPILYNGIQIEAELCDYNMGLNIPYPHF